MNPILDTLNAPKPEERLLALREVIAAEINPPEANPVYANNHIHTIYSFSPYSPAAAVYFARAAGLPTAGIMDHDSIAGAFEFIEAGKIAGILTTVGMECRVSFDGTPLEGRKINNPDQNGVAYMALHGVPHQNIDRLQNAFAPMRERRNLRNRKMLDTINNLTIPYGILLNFERDVLPISQYAYGGTVTERHIFFALAKKIKAAAGRSAVAAFLSDAMGLRLSEKQKNALSDVDSPYLLYDMLGILKADFASKVYIDATDECMNVRELCALARDIDCLLCYAYLGDVGDSVTGDKRAQKFEDDYLEELLDVLASLGVDAVTYMPSRNTPQQMERLQKLCRDRSFFEISGEDINSPRQSFICRQLAQPEFRHLTAATMTLIERENKLSAES